MFRTVPGADVWTDRSVGALYVLQTVAGRLGLPKALGSDRSGRPALWQVFARPMDQVSRLSAARLARSQMVEEVPGLGKFTEDDLYENLDWLCAHQQHIEDRLFHLRYSQGERPSLFLYDVTSTYLEGAKTMAAFGYNRDGKQGKKQLVAGLLTDEYGRPLSVEVFRENTSDPSTVYNQVRKVAERFGGGDVTLEEGQKRLREICVHVIAAPGGSDLFHFVPGQRGLRRELMRAVGLDGDIIIPPVAGIRGVEDTKRKLMTRRN